MIKEQKDDDAFGSLYRYLENPALAQSVDMHIFQNQFHSFKLIDGLLFYSKIVNSRCELSVYIQANLWKAIMKEFHDNPLAGLLGIRKTYARVSESCYFAKIQEAPYVLMSPVVMHANVITTKV